jgi:hypothetical protein
MDRNAGIISFNLGKRKDAKEITESYEKQLVAAFVFVVVIGCEETI